MLSSGSTNSFYSKFQKNYAPLPYINHHSKPHKPIPGAKFPYQLGIAKISDLPIPVSTTLSQTHFIPRISLFDLDTGLFIGKTWTGHDTFEQKRIIKNSPNDSDSLQANNDHINMTFKNLCFYMHTSITSPSVIVTIEFIFILADNSLKSGGWTFFYPFNPEKEGLDPSKIWSEDVDIEFEIDLAAKTVPIFNGSPRILLIVAPLLKSNSEGFPGLSTIPGAFLNLRFISRPDIRNVCHLWSENVWISPGDNVPGLEVFTAKEVIPKNASLAILSQVTLTIDPSINDYETRLLEKIALEHFEANPSSLLTDANGAILLPVITERRLHIGFHNSFVYMTHPVLTNIIPQLDVNGNGSELSFHGQVNLPKYIANEKNMALIFVIEYKVLITARGEPIKKSGFFQTQPTQFAENTNIEKLVCLGWGYWDIPESFDDSIQTIDVIHKPEPNPFSCLMYAPTIEVVPGQSELLTPHRLFFHDKQSLSISFKFHDENNPPISSSRGSPVMFKDIQKTFVDEATSPFVSQSNIDDSTNFKKINGKMKQLTMEGDIDEQEIYEIPESGDDVSHFPLPFKNVTITPLSRVEKARLLNAGFKQILDEDGHKPQYLGPGNNLRLDLKLEQQDLKFNDISFNFMALTFNADLFNHFGGYLPTSVYFSFQFYTYPYSTTERLHIYTGPLPATKRESDMAHHRSSSLPPSRKHVRQWSHVSQRSNKTFLPEEIAEEEHLWPGILYPFEEDGIPAYAKPPGLLLSHVVDHQSESPSAVGNPRYGPEALVHYMANKEIYIDVWDGDSLIHLGVCAVPMKALLRQGKPGIVVDQDVDIVWTELPEENIQPIKRSPSVSSMMSTSSALYSKKPKIMTVGKVHLRISNIATSKSKIPTHATYSKDLEKLSKKDSVLVLDYHETIKKRLDSIKLPKRMPEIDFELRNILKESYDERAQKLGNADSDTKNISEPIKKIQHTKKLMGKDDTESKVSFSGIDVKNPSFMYQLSREERLRDLQTMEIFRERKKKMNVEEFLREQITTRHTVICSFGQSVFVEYLLVNPYNSEHNFQIEWDDSELRLVDDVSEWKHLRYIHGIKGGLENRVIATRSNGFVEVYLLPNETMPIPFIFQSLCSGQCSASFSQDKNLGFQTNHDDESGITPRRIDVSFLNSKKMPIAILELQISPRYYYIDRAIRIFSSENDTIRKSIKFPQSTWTTKNQESPAIYDSANPSKRYLKCSNPDVICSLSELTSNSNAIELKFKYRTDPAPSTKSLYFLAYHDAYCTVLSDIWRVFVHSLQRLDVTCIIGQTNNASLIVKGGSLSRAAQCYSNQPLELLLPSAGSFLINSNSLNEINLYLKPKISGKKEIVLNIVDIDQKTLVSSWMVVSHANIPAVTKSFEINCKRGQASNKRVSYTNPYAQRRVLYLKTDSEHLLRFKEPVLEIEPGATKYIGLGFLSNNTVSVTDILVFLNDENDHIEECLRIKNLSRKLIFMEISNLQEFVPKGKRHANVHPMMSMDDEYKYLLSQSPKDSQEQELFITKSTCVWTIGSVIKQTFSVNKHENILEALWTNFNIDGINSFALVIIFQTTCKFYLDNGKIYEANVPFTISKAWSVSNGLLITRKLDPGESANSNIPCIFTWSHPLEEIKWVPYSLKYNENDSKGIGGMAGTCSKILGIDHDLLHVSKSDFSGKTLILTKRFETIYLWEFKHVSNEIRSLERNTSIYRSSPVNLLGDSQMALDLSAALGDTEADHGLQLKTTFEANLSLSNHSLKVFFTHHLDHDNLWILDSSELTSWKLKITDDVTLVEKNYFKTAIQSAVPVKALQCDECDVLILNQRNIFSLWTNSYGEISCKLPAEFQNVFEDDIKSSKRRRSSFSSNDYLPEQVSPSRSSRVVELKDSVDNCVNFVLSNGIIIRGCLEFRPKSSLMQRLFLALKDKLSPGSEAVIVKRFLEFHYGLHPETISINQKDEFQNFIITLMSFSNAKSSEMRNENVSEKAWDLMNSEFRKHRINRVIPNIVLDSLGCSNDKNHLFDMKHFIRLGGDLRSWAHNNSSLSNSDWEELLNSFHLVYESLKMNLFLRPLCYDLGGLLCVLAEILGWNHYLAFYRFDGVPYQACLIDRNVSDNTQFPFDAYRWIYNGIKSKNFNDTPSFLNKSFGADELRKICTFLNVLYSNGAKKMISEMVNCNFKKNDLFNLPAGLALIFQEVIYSCKTDNLENWNNEELAIIGREDLAELFSAKSNSSFTNPDFTQKNDPKKTQISKKIFDETYMDDFKICSLRFASDNRIERVQNMLRSSQPLTINLDIPFESKDLEISNLQQQKLKFLSWKTLSLALGRSLFTFRTMHAVPTEKINIPEICLSAKMSPTNSIVNFEEAQNDANYKDWPEFHNGVAAGVRLIDSSEHIDSSWISFNQSFSNENQIIFDSKYAGFIFGLGLNGYLRKMKAFDYYGFLISKDNISSVAVSLGLAASYCETKDPQITKLFNIHVQGLLPPGSAQLNISATTQIVSLYGLGLLYMGSLDRKMTECTLKELTRDFKTKYDPILDAHYESYSLTAGFALGMIILGNVRECAGLSDMQITSKLLKIIHQNDFATPLRGATIALGLIYLKTNQNSVAEKLVIPDNMHLLDRIPPDLISLRVIARNLILWDLIEPSKRWVESLMPGFVQSCEFQENDETNDISVRQAYGSILVGACFSIGLRFAGSSNLMAFETLLFYLDKIMSLSVSDNMSYTSKIMQSLHRQCLDTLVTSLALVMAGTGNKQLFSIFESLSNRSASDINYGNHMACNMAIGLLFLGGGFYSLGTSNKAIASLLCAFYPKYPTSSVDNSYHIQAFRHLWVLAVEKRCLVTKDIDSNEICHVPITVKIFNEASPDGVTFIDMVTPCLLPSFEILAGISIKSPRYWPLELAFVENSFHHNAILENRTIPVKKRSGHLPYLEDPEGHRSIITSSFPKNTNSDSNSRNIRIRESFIKSVSTNPQLLAFAQTFCKSDQDQSKFLISDFPSFCTNVLYECLCLDKPELLRTYLWLYEAVRHISEADYQTIWNLKIVISFYETFSYKESMFQLSERSYPNLIQPEFLENVNLRVCNNLKNLESDTRFCWLLKQYVTNGNSFTGVAPKDIVKVGIYCNYFDWPSCKVINDVATHLKKIETKYGNELEIAILLRDNFPKISFKALVMLIKRLMI